MGPRVVGKTSLLREAQRQAQAAGHATVFVTAGHGDLVASLVEALGLGPLRWQPPTVASRLREIGVSVGLPGAKVEAAFAPGEGPTVVRRLEDLLKVVEWQRRDPFRVHGSTNGAPPPARTDDDGRIGGLADRLSAGVYRLRFDTATYFAAQEITGFYPEIVVAFEVTDPAATYHVPVLLSPYAYSTYRGS